jgi:glycogen debranching enzyme
MNLLEANDGRATRVARNTLWACCDMEDGKPVVNIRESAHSEWYMYQLWNIAAWHYYLVTGDADFLAKAYETATKILAKQEAGHFNAAYGLFEGSFFVGDGISGFPEPPFDPDRHSSNALDYPEVHKALVLSANCVYVGAYKATAAMAKQLGRPQRESDQLTSKAESVAAAINKHLWMPEQKRYGFFIHGKGTRKAGTLDPSQEGGGLSLAILFGVADVERTKLILANVHRQPKGITMTWPHFARFSDERPGRQNVSVWPQINSLFSQAACIGGRIDLFQSEVENLAGLFRGSGKIREIYHHITGEHCGGYQMNSTGKITLWQAVGNQAWGAGAFCRMIFYGMFGMDFQPDGIRFAPTLPAAWGEVRLGGLRYKGMTLHITLKGEGNAIRSFEINGKSATEPFVSGSLQGEQHVTILLGQRP